MKESEYNAFLVADVHAIPLISELARVIWLDHYPSIIGMEQVLYMLDKMYSKEALEKQMAEGQVFRIIYNGDQAIGFVSISEKSDGELFLHKFYIDPAVQGKGIGADVFHRCIQEYPSARSVTLTVNRQNYKSINFYFKLGFVIDHVADFDIGDGYVMSDFVMKLKVKS